MRTPRIVSILLLAITCTSAAQTSSPIVSYAYVGTTGAQRQIYGYAIHADGTSFPSNGSPYSGPSSSVANTEHYLFATDGTYIQTYARWSNGSLHPVSRVNGIAHNQTPDGSGVGTLTLDKSGSSLYAEESDFSGPSNTAYAEFSKFNDGSLAWRANTGIDVDYGATLIFSPDNKYAYGYGCYFADWAVFAFQRSSTGALTRISPGTTYPPGSGTYCPTAMASSEKGYLAVAYRNLDDPTSPAKIAVYRHNSDGTLKLVTNKTTGFTGILAMNFDPTGQYLAAAGQNGISTYRLNSNAFLSKINGPLNSNVLFQRLRWDIYGHVIAVSQTNLYVYRTSSGWLTPVGKVHPLKNGQSLTVVSLK